MLLDRYNPAERKVPLLQKQAVRWLSNAEFPDHYNKPSFASNKILTMYIVLRVTKDYRPPKPLLLNDSEFKHDLAHSVRVV